MRNDSCIKLLPPRQVTGKASRAAIGVRDTCEA